MDQSCRDIPMRLDINHQPLNFDIYLSQVIDVPRTPSLEVPPYDFKLEQEALERVDLIIERERQKELDRQEALGKIREQEQIIKNKKLQELLDQSNPPFFNGNVTVPVTATLASNYLSPETCNSNLIEQHQQLESSSLSTSSNPSFDYSTNPIELDNPAHTAPPPTCPIETCPLTPIKCFSEPNTITQTQQDAPVTATMSNNNNAYRQQQAAICTQPQPSTTTNRDSAKSSNHCAIDTNNSKMINNSSDKEPKVNKINPREFEDMHYNPFDHLELQTIDELRELDLVFQASFANQASKQ